MTSRRRTTGFLLVGLLVALLVAGIGSYYASSHPDGLEWSAEKEGFLDTAEDSATADSPLADYAVSGVDDGRLSGGLAGVLGVAVTLVLAGGITLLVRRRHDTPDERVDADAGAPPTPRA
jgi:cobalt/nickel transport protein